MRRLASAAFFSLFCFLFFKVWLPLLYFPHFDKHKPYDVTKCTRNLFGYSFLNDEHCLTFYTATTRVAVSVETQWKIVSLLMYITDFLHKPSSKI